MKKGLKQTALEPLIATKTVQFEATRKAKTQAEQEIESFLLSQNVRLHLIKTIILCVDELVSNIIKYAFQSADSGLLHKIEMTVNITCGSICLVLVDEGTPFDLTQLPKPELKTLLEDVKLGGLGIHLVTSLMDRVTYARVDNRNVVTLFKFREESK